MTETAQTKFHIDAWFKMQMFSTEQTPCALCQLTDLSRQMTPVK